jgi:hypothetical protein
MFKFKSIVSFSNKFFKPNLFKSYSFLNFLKFPLSIPINSMKNFVLTDLIFQLIKNFGIFIFYLWDWFTLVALFLVVSISLLIIFEFNDFLDLFSKNLPLFTSWSLFLAGNLFNVEIHQPTYSEWIVNYILEIKNTYLNWMYYIYIPFYYIYYPTYWSIKLVFNIVFYPINLMVESWSLVKNICTSLVIICITYLGWSLYSLWDSILSTANYIYEGSIGLLPGLPYWA